MASTTTKTQTQKVAVPVDLLAKIKPIAAANRRSITAEVAVALEQYVRDAKQEVKRWPPWICSNDPNNGVCLCRARGFGSGWGSCSERG